MKYMRPWNNNQKPPPNRFQTRYQAPHQNNPQRYPQPCPEPTKNPASYQPNLPNKTSEPQDILTLVEPRIIWDKYGIENHYARDCLAKIPQKPKVKDFAYYAYSAQELAESEKECVTTISRNVGWT